MILHVPYGDRSVVVESKKKSRTEKTLFSIITPETFTFSQPNNWPKQVGDWSTSDKCLDYKQNSGKPNITILMAYSTCQWILPSRTTHGKKALLNHKKCTSQIFHHIPRHSSQNNYTGQNNRKTSTDITEHPNGKLYRPVIKFAFLNVVLMLAAGNSVS